MPRPPLRQERFQQIGNLRPRKRCSKTEVLTCAGDTCLALILYVLLRPVGRNLALLGAFQRLVFVAIYGVAKLFEVAALNVLPARSTDVFSVTAGGTESAIENEKVFHAFWEGTSGRTVLWTW